MVQSYNTASPLISEFKQKGNNGILILLAFFSLLFAVYIAFINGAPRLLPKADAFERQTPPTVNKIPVDYFETDSVATVVEKALYFKSLLTSTQIATLEQTYTTTLARKWSNLPCGSGCRNGVQFGTLTGVQLAAALDVIKAAAGTATNDGYDEFNQIRYSDRFLQSSGGGNNYDSTLYFISFLNTPSSSGAWMLQYGGHHFAANIAFNGGKVVGTTPNFMGVEPYAFTINNVSYTPLKEEIDSFKVLLGSLTTEQLATAKLSGTFSDCLMSPGETNGNTNTFPATKDGLIASGLTTAQKNLVLAAIRNYTRDVDDSSGSVLQAVYESEMDSTYISWTGSGTSGDTSTFLNTNTNYVRIDGPSVWIEFVCQNGVVFRNQIHYHTVYRDHLRDYGADLTGTSLPLGLLNFDASNQGKSRLLSWKTADEKSVSYFEIERSVNPSNGFTSIGRVNANNSNANSYTFSDNGSFNSDLIYYRLRMAEVDGSLKYSNVAVVKYTNSQTSISLYPNPASNLLTILLPQTTENATIKIIAANGKTVITTKRSGRNLNVDISKLAKGSYFVQLLNNGNVSSMKFIK